MPQFKIFVARFPFGNVEAPSVSNWWAETLFKLKTDARVSGIYGKEYDDTPITMTRNRAIKDAQAVGADFLVMIDSDMAPDIRVAHRKPFWPTAFDFALQHAGPCVVGVPYCGPPPHENVYVFRWAKKQDGHPNADLSVEQFGREDASERAGFEQCAALPTGLILIDMRALDVLKPPYFEYEWEDPPYNTKKASTEDVFFTRNLALAGVPQYVLWDSWAGHHKRKLVGKPTILTADSVRHNFRTALLRGHLNNEVLIHVGEGLPRDPLINPDMYRDCGAH